MPIVKNCHRSTANVAGKWLVQKTTLGLCALELLFTEWSGEG